MARALAFLAPNRYAPSAPMRRSRLMMQTEREGDGACPGVSTYRMSTYPGDTSSPVLQPDA
jgi:hypothetical protein